MGKLSHILKSYWSPPSYKWIKKSHELVRYITYKSHSEIGLMFTNLATELGHHPVQLCYMGVSIVMGVSP